jgi:hypothetical protein
MHLLDVLRRHDGLRRIACQVVGIDRAELVEPEQRQLRQQCTLARNRLVEDDVEIAEPVAGNHQDALVAHRVVVAHLAACELTQVCQFSADFRCSPAVNPCQG